MAKGTLSILFSIFFVCSLYGQKTLVRAFDFFDRKDYFSALVNFQKGYSKNPSVAAWGMAQLYLKSKDCQNADSCLKYINLSEKYYPLSLRSRFDFEAKGWSLLGIKNLQNELGELMFQSLNGHGIRQLEVYLSKSPSDLHFIETTRRRDSLWMDSCKTMSSECLKSLLRRSPKSYFQAQIERLIDLTEYEEWIQVGTEKEYKSYLIFHPESPFRSSIDNDVFNLICRDKDTSEVYRFIRTYPNSQNLNTAWKLLFQLYNPKPTSETMLQFLKNFKGYPFKSEVSGEIQDLKTALFPFSKNGEYGFMNEVGVTKIKPQFDQVSDFTEGMAVVSSRGVFGIIDKIGRLLVPMNYDLISDFEGEFSIVQKKDRFGLINRSGFLILDIQFKDLGWFSESTLFFQNDSSLYGIMGVNGVVLVSPRFEELGELNQGFARATESGLQGILNAQFEYVIPPEYDDIKFELPTGFRVSKSNKQGFISRLGKVTIPVTNDQMGALSEGCVTIENQFKFKQYPVFANSSKFDLYDCYDQYQIKSRLIDGKYLICKKSKFYLVDTLGRMSKFLPYAEVGNVGVWLPVRKEKTDKWGFINRNLEEVSLFEFEEVQRVTDRLFLVKINNKYGLLSTDLGLLIPALYDDIRVFENQYFLAEINGKKGIFTNQGKMILKTEYDLIKIFSPDLWIVMTGSDSHAFIVSKQKMIFPK